MGPGTLKGCAPRAGTGREAFAPRARTRRVRARHLALALLGVLLLASGLRLAPLLAFEVWGSDTGEYRRITEELLRDGRLSLDYHGWGIAYPWFPGLFAVAGGVSAMSGLDARASLEVLVPALAGLAAVGVAVLAYHLFRDPRAALLAGASVAVFMPHAFATSHAMPGALGHLLVLGAILLAWRTEQHRLLWAAMVVMLLALVATHHLSTYMLLLALGGMAGVRALLVARPEPSRHHVAWGALALTLAMALAWWSWARPVREQVVPTASSAGLAGLGALAALGLAALWVVPALRARWAWRYRPQFPMARRALRLVAGMFVLVLAGSAVLGFVRVPGTSVQATPATLLWFTPMLGLVGFAFLGSSFAKFRPRGPQAYGWALALLASFFAMMVLGSTVLLPYRHTEYILEVAAVLAGGGLAAMLALGAEHGRARPAALAVVALVLANGALAYPPPDILAGFQEGTSPAEMEAVRWARDHVHLAPDAVVAADHRLSSMLFGFAGLNASWEYAPLTFHAASFEEARDEMRAVDSPSGVKRVDYVLLSQPMREGLALLQWEPARPLSPEAQAKFERAPFVPACRSPEVVVYRVAWDPVEAAREVPPCRP